jgi:hypothetical protein
LGKDFFLPVKDEGLMAGCIFRQIGSFDINHIYYFYWSQLSTPPDVEKLKKKNLKKMLLLKMH